VQAGGVIDHGGARVYAAHCNLRTKRVDRNDNVAARSDLLDNRQHSVDLLGCRHMWSVR
jgi:hypothetical protein